MAEDGGLAPQAGFPARSVFKAVPASLTGSSSIKRKADCGGHAPQTQADAWSQLFSKERRFARPVHNPNEVPPAGVAPARSFSLQRILSPPRLLIPATRGKDGRSGRNCTCNIRLMKPAFRYLNYGARRWSRAGDLRPALPITNRRLRFLCLHGKNGGSRRACSPGRLSRLDLISNESRFACPVRLP